jgi:hypothetical protein
MLLSDTFAQMQVGFVSTRGAMDLIDFVRVVNVLGVS